MNGREFLDEYQKLDKTLLATSMVIMLTASLNPDERAKAADYELVKDFKNKPLTKFMMGDIFKEFFPDKLS